MNCKTARQYLHLFRQDELTDKEVWISEKLKREILKKVREE